MTSASARARQALLEIKRQGSRANREGMARYGIRAREAYGVSAPVLRSIAKRLGRDHELTLALRRTGVFEARVLAALVADPAALTPAEMDRWALEFENWADCDAACANTFDRTPHAYAVAAAWSRRPEELVRRSAFSLMAALAVHDKRAPDRAFAAFLPLIEGAAGDGRNNVKKGVNWALRQIGKRNRALNRRAVACARRIARQGSPSARWIASDALRELTGPKVRARLARAR
ncbi:MAG TPA: DNA alkylation repair protein [Candidatus Thermoplasmatota archaeon]